MAISKVMGAAKNTQLRNNSFVGGDGIQFSLFAL